MPDPIDRHPNFQTLFSQLQSRYPTSSLITELVHVQDGSFTVRAMAQISGTPLASSMASAPTVEQAEDHARLRLLHLLGLNPGFHQELQSSFSNFSGSRELNSGLATAASATALKSLSSLPLPFPAAPAETQAELLADPLANSLANGNLLERRSPPVAVPPPPPEIADPPLVFEFSEADAPSAPQPVYAFGSSATLDRSATQPLEVTAEAPAVTPVAKSRPSKAKTAAVPAAESPQPEFPSPESSSPESLKDESSQTGLPKAIAEPVGLPVIDLTPIFLQIEDEMERIGWTKAQGRSHLKAAYGKRSRQELTDEELTDFLSHLQSCPGAAVQAEPG
jgi:hypothetical protein